MWVRLTTRKQLWVDGALRHCHPGDVVDVGRQDAVRMIADRQATPFEVSPEWVSGECGVVAYQPRTLPFPSVVSTDLIIPYPRTLLWRGGSLPLHLLPAGFALLDVWEVAIPFVAYERLAVHCGTPEERERTRALVHDLRVPVYDHRLIFIRDVEAARALLEAWKEEQGCPELSLLRAVYRVKPLLLPLPPTWHAERFRPWPTSPTG